MHLTTTKVLILVVCLALVATEVANASPAPMPKGKKSKGTLFNKSKLKSICDCNFKVKTQNVFPNCFHDCFSVSQFEPLKKKTNFA